VMPWTSALCFLLAGAVLLCIAFLTYDSWIHREKRRPMATDVTVDELMLRRLKKSVAIRIATKRLANR
jgi:hypothetical protein